MFYFVGAGPGDVDLITIRGRSLLEKADIVIYAGSLVSDKHLEFCKESVSTYNSASMTLEEVMDVGIRGIREGKMVVRLHTGDPTIYGAIREQMDYLNRYNVEYEVVPGVSSFTAAAGVIKREFTLPGVSQTVIITRIKGRTPVPEEEDLESLARHKASMAIFLSVGSMERVVDALIKGYERSDVPVAVVYKATWEDQRVVTGTLKDISERVLEANIKNFAQILVGDFIEGDYERSLLYAPHFSHGFREKCK